jgi:hypothetical protein
MLFPPFIKTSRKRYQNKVNNAFSGRQRNKIIVKMYKFVIVCTQGKACQSLTCKSTYDRITISNVMATYQVHLCWQQNKIHDFNFHARTAILDHKYFLEMHLTSKIHPNRVLPTELAYSRVWHVSSMISLLCTMRRCLYRKWVLGKVYVSRTPEADNHAI